MTEVFFGIKINLLNDPQMRYIIDLLHMHTVKLGVYEQWPALNKTGLGGLVSWLLRTFSRKTQYFNSWHHELMEQAVANNVNAANGILAPVIQGAVSSKSEFSHSQAQMLAEGSFTTFTSQPALIISLIYS